MKAAATKAKEIEPERNLTAREAIRALEGFQCSPECSAAVLLAAIEEFKIDVIYLNAEIRWSADCPGKAYHRLRGYGATALEAVENLLREIGGVNQ